MYFWNEENRIGLNCVEGVLNSTVSPIEGPEQKIEQFVDEKLTSITPKWYKFDDKYGWYVHQWIFSSCEED